MTTPQQAAEAICRMLPSRGLYKEEIAQIISTALAQSMPEAGKFVHHVTQFEHDGKYQGMSCICGFSATTGYPCVDGINCLAHLNDAFTTHVATVARLEKLKNHLEFCIADTERCKGRLSYYDTLKQFQNALKILTY